MSEFIKQTAEDYDMDYSTVEYYYNLHKDNMDDFYFALEEFIYNRSKS